MALDKSPRRGSPRQLLTHAEICTRDLIEQLRTALLPGLIELRPLSRSIRRHSAFPSEATLLAALSRAVQADQDTRKLADTLLQQLQEIREQARARRREASAARA